MNTSTRSIASSGVVGGILISFLALGLD